MKFWVISALFLLVGCGKRIPLPEANEVRPPTVTAPVTDNARTELILVGFDRDQICRLIVHREWFEKGQKTRANYRLEVSTSYSHGGSGLGQQVLTFSETEENVLVWENKVTGEYLKFNVHRSDAPLRDPDFFTVKWLHHKHHHKNTCKDLRPT